MAQLARHVRRMVVVMLAVAVVVLSFVAERSMRHAAFHRSKSFMHKRWAELRAIYPLGTPSSEVVRDLEIEASAMTKRGAQRDLDVLLPLEIPAEDYRDYRGFSFTFEGGRLIAIHPIGPDGPGEPVAMTPSLTKKLSATYTN